MFRNMRSSLRAVGNGEDSHDELSPSDKHGAVVKLLSSYGSRFNFYFFSHYVVVSILFFFIVAIRSMSFVNFIVFP